MGRPADAAEHAAVLVLVPQVGDRREPDRDLDPPRLPRPPVDQLRRPGRERPAPRRRARPRSVSRGPAAPSPRASSSWRPGSRSSSTRRSSPRHRPRGGARASRRRHDRPRACRRRARPTPGRPPTTARAGSGPGTTITLAVPRRVSPAATCSMSRCATSAAARCLPPTGSDIPGVEVRVWGDRAVSYDLEPSLDGTGVVVRVTNTGRDAIPAVLSQDLARVARPRGRGRCARSSP